MIKAMLSKVIKKITNRANISLFGLLAPLDGVKEKFYQPYQIWYLKKIEESELAHEGPLINSKGDIVNPHGLIES